MYAESAAKFIAFAALWAACGWAQASPPVEHWQTRSGAQVYFVENHDLPIIDLSVEFPAGSAYDSREKAGLARMVNRVLQLGADGLDENDIDRSLADVGAVLTNRFDADRGGLALRTVSSAAQREPALRVFARVLQRPSFPAAVLAREKARAIDMIKEADTKPGRLAAVQFLRMVYGQHPYARRQAGEVDTVAKLTRDDLVAFYRAHYAASYAVVALIGDLSREEAAAVADAVTADLPQTDRPAPMLPEVEALRQPAVRWLRHPAKQSHILIGAPGMRRDDPDYFPLLVGNYILGGGGFASRLVNEIRQKRGLAYSAYSMFIARQRRGPFVIGLQTRRNETREALAVAEKTLRDFLAHGPTEQELAAAKDFLVGSFPLHLDSNRKIHDYLALIGFYHLPLSYLDDYAQNVERVTAADVRAAFARHVDAGRLVTVVVGPPAEREAAASGT